MPGNLTLTAMLPEHFLLSGIVLLIIAEIARKGAKLGLWIGLAAVIAAAASAGWLAASDLSSQPFPWHFSVTPAVLTAKALLLALAVPVVLMARTEFSDGEFNILLLSSLYGLCLLPSADSLLVLFLGLELMAMPVYALILLAFRRPESAESALKYLVLSGAASATFLLGVSLLYGSTGTLSVNAFAPLISSSDLMARAAVVCMLLALFLKAAVVPFHMWAPDTYEGASIPVTAYMATLTKGAVLLAAVQLFGNASLTDPSARYVMELMAALPLVSIVWGNLTAMRQTGFRRMIAYSSIAHAGYLFYAFLGTPQGRWQAVLFYIVAYSAANLLAFSMIPVHEDDATRDRLDTLDGLFHRDPMAASLIAVAMLSLAGLPPFPGFTAKFVIFRSVVAAGFSTYALLGLLGSFLGLFFYLRVIQRMFMRESTVSAAVPPRAITGVGLARLAGVLCLAATLLLTILPGWML